jgi:hypothetical protein
VTWMIWRTHHDLANPGMGQHWVPHFVPQQFHA